MLKRKCKDSFNPLCNLHNKILGSLKPLLYNLPIILYGFLIVFMFTSAIVQADNTASLPYVCIDRNPQFNNFDVDTLVTTVLGLNDAQTFIGDDDWIMYFDEAQWGGVYRVTVGLNPSVNGQLSYDTYQFNIAPLPIDLDNSKTYLISADDLTLQGYQFDTGAITVNMFGNRTSDYMSGSALSGDTTPRYPFALSSNVMYDGKLVICYEILTNVGTLTPFEIIGQIGASTPNSVTTTAPPSTPVWDSSLSPQENIWNYIQYIGDLIQWSYSNIINNIKGFFDNLVDNVKNFINKVIDAINNGFKNIYDNLVSFFSPLLEKINEVLTDIKNKLDYISQPFSPQDIADLFESGAIYSDFSDLKDFIDNAFGIFGDTSEPNSYTIPLHLENIPLLHCDTQYIDLGIINPVKSILRAFMWCITTFGLLYTICDALPNYLSGGDE